MSRIAIKKPWYYDSGEIFSGYYLVRVKRGGGIPDEFTYMA